MPSLLPRCSPSLLLLVWLAPVYSSTANPPLQSEANHPLTADASTKAAAVPKAPSPEQAAALRAELEAMFVTDQAQRKRIGEVEKAFGQNSQQMRELWKEQTASDNANIRRLEAIIAEFGWPLRSVVGDEAAAAAFFILQHADLARQKKYLPLARVAVAAKEMKGSHLALLEDRILLREGGKQIYGSQVHRNEAGEWEALPLQDEAGVDRRRAEVGLPPLSTYLKGFADRNGGRVASSQGLAPAPDAPPLTQKLFLPEDDDRSAHAKLAAIKFPRDAAAEEFLRGCRDFSLRFPSSPRLLLVRIHAAQNASSVSDEALASLSPWSPFDLEGEPKLDAESRGKIAVEAVQHRVNRLARGREDERDTILLQCFEEALPDHHASRAFRDRLLLYARGLPHARTRALLLRHWPDDPECARCIDFLDTIGRPFSLAFTALDGREVDTARLRGKVILIHFWSKHLADRNPLFGALREYALKRADDGLAVVGVSLDRTRGETEEVLRRLDIPWPVYQDDRGHQNPVAERLQIALLPCYLLVDRSGVLRHRGIDAFSPVLEGRIAALLSEPAPAISGAKAPSPP